MDRMLKARTAQFQIGTDKAVYSTSNQNFVKHELNNVAQAAQERANNGAELRKSHFLIGTDNQKEGPAKEGGHDNFEPTQMVKAPEPKIKIDHNGVARGVQGPDRFQSSYKYGNRMQPNPQKLGGVLTTSQSTNLPAKEHMDLRSSNFKIGRDEPVVYESQTAYYHHSHEIPEGNMLAGRNELKAKM